MRILTAAIVRKKLKKKNLSMDIRRRVLERIAYLQNLTDEKHMDLLEHLIKKNAKKLKGTTSNHIFKFRLDEANRLAFTYGKYLSNVRTEYKDSLIILDCLKHDNQENFDFSFDEQEYLEFEELSDFRKFSSDINVTTLDDIQEMGIADLDDVQIWDYYFEVESMYVLNDDELFEMDTETLDVCLSDEQDRYVKEYQKASYPTLILGGAGTGKTLMTIHMLNQFKDKNFDARCLYLTQSKALLRVAEERYEKISGASEILKLFADENISAVEFENIIEYCIRRLEVKYEHLVTYERFVKEFVQREKGLVDKLNKYQIELFDLWAEIRGTIKGGLGAYWNRADWFDQQQMQFGQSVIRELEELHVIERKGEKFSEQKYFRLTEKVLQKAEYYREKLSEKAAKAFDILYNTTMKVNPNLAMMDVESYFRMKEENSTLEKEKRELVYQICCDYQRWLGNERFDDNDLIMQMIAKGKFEKYDFIVVDEIQDYTELQIYMIKEMLNYSNHIILAGDSHQIINPTMFREERIIKLFGSDQLRIRRLTRNYRCQENIVAYGNALSELRKKYVAFMGAEEEEFSRRKGECPFILEYSEENIKALLEELKDCPSVAILVPDERVKQRVKSFFEEIPENISVVSTVSEIKGMEYKYVVCYDLIGYYHRVWQEIFEQKAKRQTKYRYYFNLMYVGISRAQNYLCIINEHDAALFDTYIEQNLGYALKRVKKFDYQKLMLHMLDRSNDAWMEFAESAMSKGDYENAISYFQRAGAEIEKIWRCKMYLLIDRYSYEEALRYAVILWDEKRAKECYAHCTKENGMAKLVEIWLEKKEFTRKNGMSVNIIGNLIKQEFADFDDDVQERLRFQYIRLLANRMQEQLLALDVTDTE